MTSLSISASQRPKDIAKYSNDAKEEQYTAPTISKSEAKREINNPRAYRNHSFDDFPRAIDSRKLLASNPVFWYNKLRKESQQTGNAEERNVPYKTMMSLYERALSLIKKVVHSPNTNENYIEPSLIKELLQRGTFADQLKIRSQQIIENPLGSLEHLDALLELYQNRRHVDKVLIVLRDLFLNYLMPYRKIIQFKDRPLKTVSGRVQSMEKKMRKNPNYVPTVDEQRIDATIMFWYFEDALKKRYADFLEATHQFVSNPYVPELQVLSMRVLREVVCLVPESRSNAMSILVGSLINPSTQPYTHSLILQMLDATAFWFCPHLSRAEVVKELLRQLYNALQLPPLKAVLKIMVITGTLKHIPLFQKDVDVQDVLLEGYMHTISTLRLMGRSRSFLDEGNPIYSGGMKNCMRGLERLLSQTIQNKEKFCEVLILILSLGEVKFLDTQVAILRLMYRAKVAFGALPENVDKYLYRRLFNSTMNTGYHSVNSTKALSDLLFSVITNDEDEARAVALLKRMLQSTFGQTDVFTGYIYRATFNILTERPALRRFFTETELSRREDLEVATDKMYQLHGGNPSYVNADRSALWELTALHRHVNPTLRKYAENIARNEMPNVHHITFEALHYNEIIRTLLNQGASKRVSRSMAYKDTREPGLAKLLKETKPDHLGFEAKLEVLTKDEKETKRKKKNKVSLGKEASSAVDEVLYGADDSDDDDDRQLMELERAAEPNVDDLHDLVEDDMKSSKKFRHDEDNVRLEVYRHDRTAAPSRPHGFGSKPIKNKKDDHLRFSMPNQVPVTSLRGKKVYKIAGEKRKERHPTGRNGEFSKRRRIGA